MKLFRSLLLASTCLLFSLDPSAAAKTETQDDDEAGVAPASRHEFFTMGFEAETSVFKVRPSQGDQTYKMMTFKAPAEKPHLWAFTSDTLDATIEKLEPPYWMNTECITLGGLNSTEIIKAAEEVKQFWDFLRTRLSDPKAEVCLTGRDIPLAVSWSDSSVEYDSIIIQKPDARDYQQRQLIYPQITFGLPLTEIHNLFELTLPPE